QLHLDGALEAKARQALDVPLEELNFQIQVPTEQELEEARQRRLQRENDRREAEQATARLDSAESSEEAKRHHRMLVDMAHGAEALLSVSARRYKLVKYKKCFSGTELVDALLQNGVASFTCPGSREGHCVTEDTREERRFTTREAAIRHAEEMLEQHVLHHVAFEQPFEDTSNYWYRFQWHAREAGVVQALNMDEIYFGTARGAVTVADDVRRAIDALYSKHLSSDGTTVDYGAIEDSAEFAAYRLLSTELQRVDVVGLPSTHKFAFWINLYNALVVHGTIVFGAAKSSLERLGWFDKVMYHVGGHDYSLNDIEHGVLRRNARMALHLRRPFRGSNDPRIYSMVPRKDARIHFALVCGARSCPPISLFTAENVDDELNAAAEAFVEGEVVVDAESKTVTMSQIFQWYAVDFGKSSRDVLRFILGFVPSSTPKHEQLRSLIDDGQFTIKYAPYDWTSNDGKVDNN
ncbi:MAG: hypothetical protein MHM6MM_005973, partial [Cercozoa sp. M6MM]